MKVSVIIPVYNTQKYLARCLDSVLAQDRDDLEIITVDDGSTDGSGAVCDDYARKDKRVRVFHKENGGVSSARNSGIDGMCGEYCCFVDSDDRISENFVSTLLGNAESRGCALSVCGLSKTDACENSGGVAVLDRRAAQFSLFDEVSGIRGYIGGKLFKTDILKRENIRFDEQQTLAEDLLFLFDYLLYCPSENAVCVSESKLYRYENSGAGALARRGSTETFREEWCDAVKACEKILEKIPEEEKSLRQAVRLEKTMQCATMIRILANYDEEARRRSYRKFLSENILSYLCCKNFGVRKKLGAVAALTFPKQLLKRRRANG